MPYNSAYATLTNASLAAAEARLDAAISATDVICTNLDRLFGLPAAVDAALDDVGDLVNIIRAKLFRALDLIETEQEARKTAQREEYPDNGPTDPWRTSGPGGAAA